MNLILANTDAETALIASCLADPLAWPMVDHVPYEAFTTSGNQETWKFLLQRRGKVTTEELVLHLSGILGEYASVLDDLGGQQMLFARLLEKARPLTELEGLAQVVIGCWVNRQTNYALKKGLNLFQPQSEGLDPYQRLEQVRSYLESIQAAGKIHSNELVEGAGEWAKEYKWRVENPGKLSGILTGFRDLDEVMLGGLEPANLLIIASSPGEGKTILAAEICRRMSQIKQHDGKVVKSGFFGAEMLGKEMYGRWLQATARLPEETLRRAKLTKEEQQRLRAAQELLKTTLLENVFYVGPGNIGTIDELRRQARYLVKSEGVGALFVDYIQRINVSRPHDKRSEDVGEITSKLKQLAAELEVPVIAISQVTRESIKNQNGRPTLWDMAESAGVERDADYTIGLWRPARHLESDRVQKLWGNIAIVELLKGRFRKRSVCYLRFDGALSAFDDLSQTDIAALAKDDAQKALKGSQGK